MNICKGLGMRQTEIVGNNCVFFTLPSLAGITVSWSQDSSNCCLSSHSPLILSIFNLRFCYSHKVSTSASFCCLALNGTTVLSGRLTVCLKDLWVIWWPVTPSLNLVMTVKRHSFHNVVRKKDKTLVQDVRQKWIYSLWKDESAW